MSIKLAFNSFEEGLYEKVLGDLEDVQPKLERLPLVDSLVHILRGFYAFNFSGNIN